MFVWRFELDSSGMTSSERAPATSLALAVQGFAVRHRHGRWAISSAVERHVQLWAAEPMARFFPQTAPG